MNPPALPTHQVMRVRLVSDSCARGWAGWGRGELWLTDDALVRVGKLKPTPPLFRHLSVPDQMDLEPDSWTHYLATHRDVQVLPYNEIVEARLTAGLTTTSLAVRLRPGVRVRLLWRRNPRTLPAIRAALPAMMAACA